LARLSPTDRLRLLLFDAELRRLPRPFLDALWAGVDALEGRRSAMGCSPVRRARRCGAESTSPVPHTERFGHGLPAADELC